MDKANIAPTFNQITFEVSEADFFADISITAMGHVN